MRLLLDHCVPHRLREMLPGHETSTAGEQGWDRLRNGSLLAAAAAGGFDAVITVDQNLKHQQNPATLPIAVVVIVSRSNDIDALRHAMPAVAAALVTFRPRVLHEVHAT